MTTHAAKSHKTCKYGKAKTTPDIFPGIPKKVWNLSVVQYFEKSLKSPTRQWWCNFTKHQDYDVFILICTCCFYLHVFSSFAVRWALLALVLKWQIRKHQNIGHLFVVFSDLPLYFFFSSSSFVFWFAVVFLFAIVYSFAVLSYLLFFFLFAVVLCDFMLWFAFQGPH